MVDVLNEGISTVLGLNAIQAHLNLSQEFQDPLSAGIGVLRPGYYVMVDAPRATFDATQLRVIDGRLYTALSEKDFTPYSEHDFVLYSITSHATLSSAVDMFDELYTNVLTELIGSKSDANRLAQAAQAYHRLQTRIVEAPDLTRDDKTGLLAYFDESLNSAALRVAVNLKASSVTFAPGGRSRLPAQLPRASQAGYERLRQHLDGAMSDTDPRTLAGMTAGQFETRLAGATTDAA
jgi:hypothetical protein